MRMPGFTGAISLYKTTYHYVATTQGSGAGPTLAGQLRQCPPPQQMCGFANGFELVRPRANQRDALSPWRPQWTIGSAERRNSPVTQRPAEDDIGLALIPLYPTLVSVPVSKPAYRFKSRDVVVIFYIHGQSVEHANSFFAREVEILPLLMGRISQHWVLATDSTTRASVSRSELPGQIGDSEGSDLVSFSA